MSRLFDDANSQYLINTAAALTAVPLSMAAWYYCDNGAPNDDQYLIDLHNVASAASRNSLSLGLQGASGSPLSIIAVAAQSNAVSRAVCGTWTANTWQHAGAIFPSNSSRTAYLNGTPGTAQTTSRTPSGIDRTTVGRETSSSPSRYMSGRIADAAIWNVALTDAEIAALARGVSPLRIRRANLIAYWPLYGTASPEIDLCGAWPLTLSGTGTIAQADHAPVAPLFFTSGWHGTFVAAQNIAVGQVTETDLAQAVAVQLRRLIGQSLSTETAQAITAHKSSAVAQATETDLAQSLTSRKIAALAQALETDLAQAVAWAPKHRLVAQATETDLAQAIASLKTLAIAQAFETDLAQAVANAPLRRLIIAATETDLAQALTALKTLQLAQATETDLAQALTALKTLAIAQATETDLAQTVTTSGHAIAVDQVLETDLAQIVLWSPKIRLLGQITETDLAQAITALKTQTLGMVSETSLAQALTAAKAREVAQAIETDLAQALASLKTLAIAQTVETDLAQTVLRNPQARLLGIAEETDLAQEIAFGAFLVLVSQVTETDLAQPIVARLVAQIALLCAQLSIRPALAGTVDIDPWLSGTAKVRPGLECDVDLRKCD